MRLSAWEIAAILVVVLIVFGVGKLPEIGGAIGKGLREFRKAQHGDYEEKEKSSQEISANLTKTSGSK